MKKLACPNCGGCQIQVLNAAPAGTKTSLNMNPLQPLTITNTKKVKKKVSGAKVGAAILTGGTSLLFTGIHKKVGVQVVCNQCGCVWEYKG